MPDTGHVHRITPIAWTTRGGDFPPGVLLGCTHGVCSKTEAVIPGKRDRKVPPGMTKEQFAQMKQGAYWPEIMQGAE